MNALARVAEEMRVAQLPTGDRAYHGLKEAAASGSEITLSNHDLVLAVSRALWNRQLATAQLGLSELETRTALTTVEERRAA